MSERAVLPVVALRNTVVFPGLVTPIAVGREATLRAVDHASAGEQRVFAVAQRDNVDRPSGDDLFTMGVVARISGLQRGKGVAHVMLEAESRATALEYRRVDGRIEAVCMPIKDVPPLSPDEPAFQALLEELRGRAKLLAGKRGVPEKLLSRVLETATEPGALADLIAGHLELPVALRQALLETTDVEERLRKVLVEVQRQLDVREAREEIQSKVQEELGERQRELLLREQMKAIKKELGEGGGNDEIARLRERLDALSLPEQGRAEVKRELTRLERSGPESAESQVIRSYLEWIADLPWGKLTDDQLDVANAEAVLEADHYGLGEVKDRVLEYLAVRQLRASEEQALGEVEEPEPEPETETETEPTPGAKGPILLFVGPPGVGKTSIGKSIARAMGREYVRIALGGVRDEADVRGHRRTYVGAMPGRIVQALKQAGTSNPVVLLDEVDKLGASYQGNPASALLEVLDPAQNHTFVDHYLNIPVDLSQVLFIATANLMEGIPAPLLDRMEVVEFSGYTEIEKAAIARKYLAPRQFAEAGLQAHDVALSDAALASVVTRYTREAGVRQLERRIAAIARKLARKIAAGEEVAGDVTEADVRALLGRPKVRPESIGEHDEVGLATGMYYTSAGGDIMFVETSIRRLSDFGHADTSMQVEGWGNVSLILTGQLGDVMKESARAALTYASTRASSLDVPSDRTGAIEAHIHVPAGAVPKDGPSAGVAMATGLVSAMTGRPVRREVAMTGEVTLRGRVLPIGGLKEKVLGAHRAGIKHIILPQDNEADIEDLPKEVRETLRFSPVSSVDEVLELALAPVQRAPEPESGRQRDPGVELPPTTH